MRGISFNHDEATKRTSDTLGLPNAVSAFPVPRHRTGSWKLQSISVGDVIKHIFLSLTPVSDSVHFNKLPRDIGGTGSGKAL